MVFGLGSGDMIVLTDPLEGAICLLQGESWSRFVSTSKTKLHLCLTTKSKNHY